jgi:hypothetical protein
MAFGINELERMRISSFRDFPFNEQNAGVSLQVVAQAASATSGT